MVGRTVGQYEIVAKLGGGGMGVVYQARDTKLGRPVALKFLPPQWSHDETAKQRFVREAQTASATDHPNICTIHDIGTTDDGQLFIVMAYYDGQTLKQRLEAGPLPVDEALDIATQIADGLAKAHAQGIVHRDIKPGNVIVTDDAVKIVDFGLAKFADALQLTITGSTIGTAAYMSPEQTRGEEVDSRSDVWSLGVVLYEMLAGHPPFRGAYTEAVTYAIRHDSPPPLRVVRPEISEDVEQLVFRALHKDPAVRYRSGRELARALRQVRGQSVPLDLRTEPVVLPDPLVRTAPPTRPRGRTAALVSVLAVLALAVVTAGVLWLLPVDRTHVVVAPFVNQTGDLDLEQYRLALTHTLTLTLRDSRDVAVTPYERVLEVLRGVLGGGGDPSSREAMQAITANTAAPVVVVPTLLGEGGAWWARVELRNSITSTSTWTFETERVTTSLGRDAAFRLTLALAEPIVRQLEGRRSRTLRGVLGLVGMSPAAPAAHVQSLDAARVFADGMGWYEEQEFARAIQAFRATADLDPRSALTLSWLSRSALLARDQEAAAEAAERASATLSSDAPRVDALLVRAVVAEARRDRDTAARAYRTLVSERPGEQGWLMELAGFLDRQGEAAEAVATYHAALEVESALLRPRLELCRLYSPSRLNEPAEAKSHGEAALAGYRTLEARGGEGQSLMCLGDVLAFGGTEDRIEGRRHIEAARRIFQELGASYNLARTDYYLALVAGVQGNFTEALTLGEQALASSSAAGNAAVQPIVLSNLGAVHGELGNPLEAAEYYRQAYTIYESWQDETRAARVQANRAALLIEYGNPDEGLREAINALAVSERTGDKRFEAFCLRVIATYHRIRGRHQEAVNTLNKALAIARERSLAESAVVIRTHLALSQFQLADYRGARESLLEALEEGTGRRSTEARIRLAWTEIRLGDLASARAGLDRAEGELEASPNGAVLALLWLVRGEWSSESSRPGEAAAYFRRASASATASVPDATSVEAQAHLARIVAEEGRPDEGERIARAALDAAQRLGQIAPEARCRLSLAAIALVQRRPDAAEAVIATIPTDDARQTVGAELRAEVNHLRSRVHAARGDQVASAAEADAARTAIAAIADRLPAASRRAFEGRLKIRQLVQ